MLTKVSIKNFQSIENITIPDLGNVNLILGPNNSGKSAILKAINFPTQSYIENTVPIWGEETYISPYLPNFKDTVFNKEIRRGHNIEITYYIKPKNMLNNHIYRLKKLLPDTFTKYNFNEILLKVEIGSNNNVYESVFDKDNNLIYSKIRDILNISKLGIKERIEGNATTPDWRLRQKSRFHIPINGIHNFIKKFFRGIYLFVTDRKPRDWRTTPKKT